MTPPAAPCGCSPSPTRAALGRFLAENPKGRHGAIDYRLEDLGLEAGERREALRFYAERFEVPFEEAR
jgi:hypothetical protein